MNYRYFGAMLDVSRNGVMRPSQIKQFILYLEKMGYNMLELYTEDTYKIDGEPLFGYMRGAYTKEEIQDVDKFAREHGIELVPCIQTLAHMNNLKKIPQYQEYFDTKDILLTGDEEVYALIDKMFKQMSEAYTSRIINIGMDEAGMVGRGTYLDRNGYRTRFDIIREHLDRVLEIADKYGFKCHMWSDMFFRLANDDQYRPEGYDPITIPDEVIEKTPKNVGLAYWDYANTSRDKYNRMLSAHKQFGCEVWYAGGAWCWQGFAPENAFSMKAMLPAMQSCRENNIENVLMTLWGDDGNECSPFAMLPSLYAIRKFADGIENMEEIKRGFKETLGFDFDDFMTLDLPTTIMKGGVQDLRFNTIPSLLTYNDPFIGLFDYGLMQIDRIDFASYALQIKKARKNMGELDYIFDYVEKICDFLAEKAYIGIDARRAYKAGDRKALAEIAKRCARGAKKMDAFIKSYYYRWDRENKPFGWEVQDIRLGGAKQRLLTCKDKINDYLKGKRQSIEELEEEVMSLADRDLLRHHRYTDICTPSSFAHCIYD